MKIIQAICFAALTISSTSFAKPPLNFKANCEAVVAKFKSQVISYSYINFQGKEVAVSPTYTLASTHCVSDQDRHYVNAFNALNPTIQIPLLGILNKDSGNVEYKAENIGTCASESTNLFVANLTSRNVVVNDQIKTAVFNSYNSNACPLLIKGLEATLDRIEKELNAE